MAPSPRKRPHAVWAKLAGIPATWIAIAMLIIQAMLIIPQGGPDATKAPGSRRDKRARHASSLLNQTPAFAQPNSRIVEHASRGPIMPAAPARVADGLSRVRHDNIP